MNKENNKSKNRKIKLARNSAQLVFFILLAAGLYKDIRYVLLVFLPVSLLFGNFFCGWVCPYGTVQEVMGRLGRKLIKKRYKMPGSIQKYLQFLRYILFVFILIGVLDLVLKPLNGYGTFIGQFSEGFTNTGSLLALAILLFYLILSVFFERAFCNYLCTEAAKHGILSMIRMFSIKRNANSCIKCKKCDLVCPMNIEISVHDHVRNGQCINCLECINTCPEPGTLQYSRVKSPLDKPKKYPEIF